MKHMQMQKQKKEWKKPKETGKRGREAKIYKDDQPYQLIRQTINISETTSTLISSLQCPYHVIPAITAYVTYVREVR
jgi:hypothetical protein